MAKSLRTRVLQSPKRCGCSSVVERDLAKVDVESSNLFTRSSFLKGSEVFLGAFFFILGE